LNEVTAGCASTGVPVVSNMAATAAALMPRKLIVTLPRLEPTQPGARDKPATAMLTAERPAASSES
jgi:hypothetical protein